MITVTWAQLAAFFILHVFVMWRIVAARNEVDAGSETKTCTIRVELDKETSERTNGELLAMQERVERLTASVERYNTLVTGQK